MRYIENYELREWVKESLKKSIFQKAHALALQTGCEILVKLEDVTDKSGSQYYATRNLQQAYRHGGVSEKPGERCIAGNTGLPTTHTAEIAIQSDDRESVLDSSSVKLRTCGRDDVYSRIRDGVYSKRMSRNHHGNNTSNSTPSDQYSTNDSIRYSSPSIFPSKFTNNINQPHQSDSIEQANSNSRVQSNNEANNTETTVMPSGIKMEVHEVTEDSANQNFSEQMMNSSNDHMDDDDVMAPLSTEEDICEDHFGDTGDLEGPEDQPLFHCTITEANNSDVSLPFQGSQQHSPSSSCYTPNSTVQNFPPTTPNSNVSRNLVPASISKYNNTISRTHHFHIQPHSGQQQTPILSSEDVNSMLSYPVTLPVFSSRVKAALEAGKIHNGKMWSQFCKESSQFYQPLLDIYDAACMDKQSQSMVYQSIGRTMYDRYPCIAGDTGIRPWTMFNKWLSTKIRQARFQAKAKKKEVENEDQFLT